MDEFQISKPRVVVATPEVNPEDTKIFKNIEEYGLQCNYITGNSEKITKIYNQQLDLAKEDGVDCLIIVHGDVILQENPITKLRDYLFNCYDLVGVAGTSKITLQSPALWHLMGGGFDGGKLHGLVNHSMDDGETFHPTYFGQFPSRVLMIDGVFMALNRNCIEKARFDENIPSRFHFYDLDFSLSCHKKGLSVGVGDIRLTHLSPGLREFTQEWIDGNDYFLNKHG